MSDGDDDLTIRPGRGRADGAVPRRAASRLAAQVKRAALRAGHARRGVAKRGGTGPSGRGRRVALSLGTDPSRRRVVVKARVVRRTGPRFRAAPLSRHIQYLERDGVTRDGRDAAVFDAGSDAADGVDFAARTEDDRHHFRFIVSPEDAAHLDDLRGFTRELMTDVAADLGTRLDWIAIDHWNTDNPHVHVLVRGVADDGGDLVIDRDYIRTGMRARAETRMTLELGARTEHQIAAALGRDVDADRWTDLDRRLDQMAERGDGIIDLRRAADGDGALTPPDRHLVGRAMKLERLGLAEALGPARWRLRSDLEATLRDLGLRGDIIKTMHRAMTRSGQAIDMSGFALHTAPPDQPVIGRLVERGLHDELTGTAYAIIDGADGRIHHLRFDDLDLTSDARSGAVVEVRQWQSTSGRMAQSLAVRSDLPLHTQISAGGATWLDRQLLTREGVATGGGFGAEIRAAMVARAEHLVAQRLANRQGDRIVFVTDLIERLRGREIEDAGQAIATRTGSPYRPVEAGDRISGIYRERVTLASGRFAMIDDGMGFQLVPWRPALERELGQHVIGTARAGGGMDWTRGRDPGLTR